jgi:hypothetical protein
MAWDRKSVMCVTVGATLIHLQQIDSATTFAAIGPMKMQDLQFYNTSVSSDINKASATQLATTIDSILTNSYGDSYQSGYGSNKAISAMVAIMIIATNTVENFSDTIVKAYLPH